MSRKRIAGILLATLMVLSAAGTALAAEVDCDATYCFTPADFSEKGDLKGICITHLPDTNAGTVMLGSRVIRGGDILTAEQLAQMTFSPLRTETDTDAIVTYLPIYENRVEPSTTMTISIRGKEDKAPVAQDQSLETYKNLPNTGALKVSDPEGQPLTYTLVRQPKRGELLLNTDGTFTYTPKRNKVGVDSFTFTAADPAGNVSREATVTVQILKPTDAKQYTDTIGKDCRFAAEWMRNTGLFVGEKIGNQECFHPEKEVSRGQFLAMVINTLQIPTDDISYSEIPQDTPEWFRPYLTAAMRSGLTAGLPVAESGSFEAGSPITGAEAAVILQNALDLSISRETMESSAVAAVEDIQEEVPVWASVSLTAMADHGIQVAANDPLTRSDVAQMLYQVSYLSIDAPGMQVLRKQK